MELRQHTMSSTPHCCSVFDIESKDYWSASPSSRFSTLDDLKEALSNFVDLNGCGGLALEIGLDALADSSGKDPIFYESSHVRHLMLQALRNPKATESPCEIILASIGVWGMIEDLGDEARTNLMSLLEVAFSVVDQNHFNQA